MATKIVRKDQLIFALGASNNGQFGSAEAATFVTSLDPAVIMALPAWNNGWSDAVISGEKLPTLEEMQGTNYVNTYQLGYLFQEGIPEYSAGTAYFQHSIVKQPGSYQLYGSLTDNNTGNVLTDPTKWQKLSNLQNVRQVYVGAITTGSANVQATATTNGDFTKTYGYIVGCQAGFANTGAATLNVDGTGATAIKKNGVSGLIDIVLGDMIAGEFYQFEYNGTFFVLIDPTLPVFGTMATQNANNVAITGGTISIQDTNFSLFNNGDATKIAQFDCSAITTGNTRIYTLPNLAAATLATVGNLAQTFLGATTFSGATFTISTVNTISLGTGTAAATIGLGTGATLAATTKTINIGTAGVSTSVTNINLGSSVVGATGTLTISSLTYANAATSVTFSAAPISAQGFIPTSATLVTNGMYLPGVNTLGWAINSSAKLQLTSTALAPAVSAGSDLGTIALMWGNLFLQSGAVINFNNGNATLTHSAGNLTSSVPLTASNFVPSATTVPVNGFYLVSANNPGISANSYGIVQFTNSGTANFLQISSAATANNPGISAQGTDASVTIALSAKGVNGSVNVYSGGGTSINVSMGAANGNATVNYHQFLGNQTGNGTIWASQGSDTNVEMWIIPKGTGAVRIFCNSGSTAGFAFVGTGTVVNHIIFNATATGTSPSIDMAAGSGDTNVNFTTVAKGTGVLLNLGSFTNGTTGSANVIISATGAIQKTTSMRKYKTDIEDIDIQHALYFAEKVRPIFFRSICPGDLVNNMPSDWTHYSYIADEVAKLDPRCAHYGPEPLDKFNKNGQMLLGKVVPIGVQTERIHTLILVAHKTRIEKLEQTVAEQAKEIESLKSQITLC